MSGVGHNLTALRALLNLLHDYPGEWKLNIDWTIRQWVGCQPEVAQEFLAPLEGRVISPDTTLRELREILLFEQAVRT